MTLGTLSLIKLRCVFPSRWRCNIYDADWRRTHMENCTRTVIFKLTPPGCRLRYLFIFWRILIFLRFGDVCYFIQHNAYVDFPQKKHPLCWATTSELNVIASDISFFIASVLFMDIHKKRRRNACKKCGNFRHKKTMWVVACLRNFIWLMWCFQFSPRILSRHETWWLSVNCILMIHTWDILSCLQHLWTMDFIAKIT